MITEETVKELSDNELSEKINLLTEEQDRREDVKEANEQWVKKSKFLPAYSSLRSRLIKELPNCDVFFPGLFDTDSIEVFSNYYGNYVSVREFYKKSSLYTESYDECLKNNYEVYNFDETEVVSFLKRFLKGYVSNIEKCICISNFYYSFNSRFQHDLKDPIVCIVFCIFPKSDLKLNRHEFPFPY